MGVSIDPHNLLQSNDFVRVFREIYPRIAQVQKLNTTLKEKIIIIFNFPNLTRYYPALSNLTKVPDGISVTSQYFFTFYYELSGRRQCVNLQDNCRLIAYANC